MVESLAPLCVLALKLRILLSSQVWDTAGQERFRSITRAYYRGSRGLLVVYDITVRSSWENAKYWVEEVRRTLADDVDMMPFILGTAVLTLAFCVLQHQHSIVCVCVCV